jgi:clathrin heavy chain
MKEEKERNSLSYEQFLMVLTCGSDVHLFHFFDTFHIFQAIEFYIQEQPTLVSDLLTALAASGQIDNARVVNVVRKLGQLPLIKKYLVLVQEVLSLNSVFFFPCVLMFFIFSV